MLITKRLAIWPFFRSFLPNYPPCNNLNFIFRIYLFQQQQLLLFSLFPPGQQATKRSTTTRSGQLTATILVGARRIGNYTSPTPRLGICTSLCAPLSFELTRKALDKHLFPLDLELPRTSSNPLLLPSSPRITLFTDIYKAIKALKIGIILIYFN